MIRDTAFSNKIQCRCDQGHVRLEIKYNAVVIRDTCILKIINKNAAHCNLEPRIATLRNEMQCCCDQGHVRLEIIFKNAAHCNLEK